MRRVLTAADEYDRCAIQEAIYRADATVAASGPHVVEEVYIPAGSYKINRTLHVPVNAAPSARTITIRGAGNRGNALAGTLLTLTTNTTLFLIPGLTTLRDMTLIGNSHTAAASIAVRIGGVVAAGDPWTNENSVKVELERIYIGAGFYNKVHALYEVDHLHIRYCIFTGVVGNAHIYLFNSHADTSALYGLNISPSAGIVIEQCQITADSDQLDENLYGIICAARKIVLCAAARSTDQTAVSIWMVKQACATTGCSCKVSTASGTAI